MKFNGLGKRGAAACVLSFYVFNSSVFAGPVSDLLQKANDSFSKRTAQENDPAVLDTIALLKDAAALNASAADEVAAKYQTLMLLARAYYTAGSLVAYSENEKGAEHDRQKAKRMELFDAGRSAALAGQSVDDKHAEGYYFYAINLARWANTKGVGESIGRRKELADNLIRAKTKLTVDGKKGETLDGFGPLRTEGRAAYKLPPGVGQNVNLSYSDLKKAAEGAPFVASNVLFYASTLRWDGNKKDAKGKTGKEIIQALVGDAKSAEEAADRFIETFKGTAFEEAAKSRRPETVKDFIEDVKEPAAYVGVTVPWVK